MSEKRRMSSRAVFCLQRTCLCGSLHHHLLICILQCLIVGAEQIHGRIVLIGSVGDGCLLGDNWCWCQLRCPISCSSLGRPEKKRNSGSSIVHKPLSSIRNVKPAEQKKIGILWMHSFGLTWILTKRGRARSIAE